MTPATRQLYARCCGSARDMAKAHYAKEFKQLRPGQYLAFSRGGLTMGTFFSLVEALVEARANQRALSDRDLIGAGEAMFLEFVRRRLTADVPVGLYLSGGLDSSLIAAAMRSTLGSGKDIHTFSVGYQDDPRSELAQAEHVSRIVNAQHHAVRVGPADFISRWPALSARRDSPLSEPAEVAFATMSEIAKDRVSVALSGEGADEIFAGYPKYKFAATPWVARYALRLLGTERVSSLAQLTGLDATRAVIATRALAHPSEIDRLTQWFSDGNRADLRRLLPGLDWSDENWAQTNCDAEAALTLSPKSTPLRRMQVLDCLTWLPGNILAYGDRMSMAHGLEVRLPFLNVPLAAFGLGLPDRLKVRAGQQKWLPRQWRVGSLPANVLSRRKWGFRAPLAQWFRGPLRSLLRDHLTDPRGLCAQYGDAAALEQLLAAHDSGRVDLSAKLWKLLSTEMWCQHG